MNESNKQDSVSPRCHSRSLETDAVVVLLHSEEDQDWPWCQGNERRRPRGSESGTGIRDLRTPTEPGWWASHSQTCSLSGSGTSLLHSRSAKRSKQFQFNHTCGLELYLKQKRIFYAIKWGLGLLPFPALLLEHFNNHLERLMSDAWYLTVFDAGAPP